MKITKLTELENSQIKSSPGMASYLHSLTRPKATTPRSWLYEDSSPEDVLQRWLSTMETELRKAKFGERVLQFEAAQLSKFGAQGGHPPTNAVLKDKVLPSFSNLGTQSAFKTAAWRAAKRNATKALMNAGVRNLRPASYASVAAKMHDDGKLYTNSGWPSFARRVLRYVKREAVRDATTGQYKRYPAILLWRYYNAKLRPVWMFPFSTNVVESSFTTVLQEALERGNDQLGKFFSPWEGFESVKCLVTDQYNQGKFLSASDFSETDAHFKEATSREAYDVVAPCFQPAFRDALWDSIEHMHNIPILTGPDQKVTGSHGVASGSAWTNLIETIFDFILSEYVRILTKGKMRGLYAIGDDMTWVTDHYWVLANDFLEQVGESVGQVIKAEKVTVEANWLKSLQRLFIRGWFSEYHPDELRGVYSTIRALKSLLYPERFHSPKEWDKDAFAIRTFQILENCYDHPMFEAFVKFVLDGHPHLRIFAKQSPKQIERAVKRHSTLNLNPTYNKEKRGAKLSEFKSIQIARAA